MGRHPAVDALLPATTARQALTPAVIHLVGRLTDVVASFLGPASAALAEAGATQTLIVIDDSLLQRQLPRLHSAVRVVRLADHASVLRRVSRARTALRDCLRERPDATVHLHGIVPSALGAYATRIQGIRSGPMYFSPHGSKSLGPLRAAGAALLWAMRPFSGPRGQHAIAHVRADVFRLQPFAPRPVDLIECAIDRAFFEMPQGIEARPLIVTAQVATPSARHPRGAAIFSQFAVLLGEEEPRPAFAWLGEPDSESRQQLAAANVAIHDDLSEIERARQLAAGWVFVAPIEALGFPVRLAEAMAVGLPCVALDTPYHRDVVRHGETGFLCASEGQMCERIAQLLQSPELRLALGRASREDAMRRFGTRRFEDSLLAAYGVRT